MTATSTGTRPAGTTVAQYADRIMHLIRHDQTSTWDGGHRNRDGSRFVMAADVPDFPTLHLYVDANCYLLDMLPEMPCGPSRAYDEWEALANAVSAEVDRRLRRAAATLTPRVPGPQVLRVARTIARSHGTSYAHAA